MTNHTWTDDEFRKFKINEDHYQVLVWWEPDEMNDGLWAGASMRDATREIVRLAEELTRLRGCIVRAADALVANDPIEAYHQLYAAADPNFRLRVSPFEQWRVKATIENE